MGIHGKITGTGERVPSAEMLVQYQALEECILSGQVSHAEVHELLREDPEFAHWFRARALNRSRGCVFPAI